MPLPTRQQFAAIAERAGGVALDSFRRVLPERKPDRTLVTAADRAVEALLVDDLRQLMPDAGVLGEEGARRASGDGTHLVIDPIDGTAAFVAGLPTWCICIGVMRGLEPVAGVVHLPLTGETFVAVEGQAWVNDVPLPPLGGRDAGDPFVVAHAKVHVRHRLTYPGKIRSLGSTAYHLMLVARGVAEAALLGRVQVWDLVGPLAILHAVGGEARTFDGRPLDFAPMLAGQPLPDYAVAAPRDRLAELLPQLGAP